MKKDRKYLLFILVGFLLIIAFIFVFYIYKDAKSKKYLRVVFLDVGQGDSIFIEAPNKKQILIDGGPDAKVLAQLSKVMPFYDRTIDLVIATHNDADHIGGLPLVFDYYKISNFIGNGASSSSSNYKVLKQKIDNNKVDEIVAKKGTKIILDKENNIYLDILFPNMDIAKMDSNDGSIVSRLVYNEDTFLFMGDATVYTENLIKWSTDKSEIESDVLKLGHHGSRTSSSQFWLEEVSPRVVIISAGKNNNYGHPHNEILDRLKLLKIPYLTTYNNGNILFKTDGVNLKY